MADKFCLLFQPVFAELLTGLDRIIIAAERMALQRQENALLVLPDMHHFVDEQPLA